MAKQKSKDKIIKQQNWIIFIIMVLLVITFTALMYSEKRYNPDWNKIVSIDDSSHVNYTNIFGMTKPVYSEHGMIQANPVENQIVVIECINSSMALNNGKLICRKN